jgi:hypothetical protein
LVPIYGWNGDPDAGLKWVDPAVFIFAAGCATFVALLLGVAFLPVSDFFSIAIVFIPSSLNSNCPTSHLIAVVVPNTLFFVVDLVSHVRREIIFSQNANGEAFIASPSESRCWGYGVSRRISL